MHAENKLGPHDQSMGQSIHTQKSFLYRAISVYNKLPKNLTLSPNHKIFKKWCKMYNLNTQVKIPSRNYNEKPRETYTFEIDVILRCEEHDD